MFYESLKGATRLTRKLFVHEKKPFIVLDAKQITEIAAADAIVRFVEENQVAELNMAGSRLSGWSEGYGFAVEVVQGVIGNLQGRT